MRIAVLGSGESWYFRDLARAAAALGVPLDAIPFSRLSAWAGGAQRAATAKSGDCRLDAFDAVLVRTMPPGSLEQVVFRMDVLGCLESAGLVVVNSAKAIETAVDKFLTIAKLSDAGLSTPDTFACQDYDAAMAAFHQLGGDVVVKPLFGGEGRGLMHIDDEAMAHRAFRTLDQLQSVVYLQPFLAGASEDIRLFRIGDAVWGMRRRNERDWRSNISQGGQAEAIAVTEPLRELALRAADAVGAEIAGVDVLPNNGKPLILEVNAVPGWRALQRVVEVDLSSRVLEHLLRRVDSRTRSRATADPLDESVS